ncbi:methyltransferase domain-containing protein [Roseateles koreensis]|uniref:Methyltransferase domain-containing protein n=1 Tax=Roseateles koreensis TaxID=2987526 RepID=A0ABT5KP69_9BURK|nr:methyltransferase domain-containing protein [Roseateles koreensis]MDC8784163.1 methyltransferase domain-containing protein [Roseateles koreensis]
MQSSSSSEISDNTRPQAVDAVAVARQMRRLALADGPPWLHQEVARRMAERLSIIKMQPQSVLQWSAFLGGGGEALAQIYPRAQQVCVEPAPALLARSQAVHKTPWWQPWAAGRAARVVAPDEVPDESFELLWANMALHACTDLPQILQQWHRGLARDGFVMFSCLGPDSFLELRQLYRTQGWARPGPDWWDMHDIGDLLVQAGFADPVMDQERLTLTWADPQTLLKDLRAMGGNIAPSRFSGCRGRFWHQALLRTLEQLRGPDGRLRLTLEIVYGHAFKPEPKIRVSAETTLSLDQMRAMIQKTR